MFKRIGLFILTNILVIATITIVLNLLGVGNYLQGGQIDYRSLAIICLVWGMVGSLISLAMSRFMAKKLMGVQVIDPNRSGEFAWLVQMVHQLARKANLPAMPEVGIYDSPETNAFATGPTKSRSLVAVSSGLLSRMNKQEIEGVMAHEVAHIQNGDMVTMTLLQGVINAFVMFVARVAAFAISQNVKEENRGVVNFLVVIVLQILLGLLGSLVVAWFSRQREFRADRGSAQLTGSTAPMIAALEALQRNYGQAVVEEAHHHPAMAAMKISGIKRGSFDLLRATHPPLEQRIARLKSTSR